jgi:hypothetical protein
MLKRDPRPFAMAMAPGGYGGARAAPPDRSRKAERLARRLEVQGTPSFYLVRDGGEPEPIEIDQLGGALGGG